jgi:hypothetical protein
VYAALGSTLAPSTTNPDLVIAPFTYIQQPIAPSTQFAFAIGAASLPTSTTQGAVIQITFFDAEQASLVANIALPGAGYQLSYLYTEPVIANNTSTTLVPAATGKKINLFYVRLMPDPTVAASAFSLWHTVDPDICYLSAFAGSGTAPPYIDSLDAKPHGFALPAGRPLNTTNVSGGTRQPGFFVLYNYA